MLRQSKRSWNGFENTGGNQNAAAVLSAGREEQDSWSLWFYGYYSYGHIDARIVNVDYWISIYGPDHPTKEAKLKDRAISNESCGWIDLESHRRLFRQLDRSGSSLIFGIATLVALLGLAVRIVLLFLAGNREIGPLSGVGDQFRYLTLADSIFQGRGFTYAGQPTALRSPLYPLLLAGSHVAFGSHYLIAMRIFQFLLGVAVAYICFLIAKNIFGIGAGMMAAAIALALPTLVFISTELQTEQLSTFLTVLFLLFYFRVIRGMKNCAIPMGMTSGFLSLVRFNAALLPLIGAVVCWWSQRTLKGALVVCFVAGLIVLPWIVHNAEVFHGKILFSSHGGINFLEGVLTPDGRAQNGEGERVRAAVGWMHTDIETNDSHRLLFPSEDQLDIQARAAAVREWENLGWTPRIRLLTGKCLSFWLSTDQLFETKSFSDTQRRLRAAGVIVYWIVLAFAFVGWTRLYSSSRVLALEIGFYVAFVTLAHLPFVMNTRLRIPFFDPLLSILAAGGLMAMWGRLHKSRQRGFQDHSTKLRLTATLRNELVLEP